MGRQPPQIAAEHSEGYRLETAAAALTDGGVRGRAIGGGGGGRSRTEMGREGNGWAQVQLHQVAGVFGQW